jgi:hypothetical protein
MKTTVINYKLDFKEGLYYGHNNGFFPQPLIFVWLKKDRAYIESFLPLKGEYFFINKDSLVLVNNKFVGKKYLLFKKNNKMFVEFKKSKKWKNPIKIDYLPQKEIEYKLIKENAQPLYD